MKWYLIWFFLVQTNGEVNQTYTQSLPMATQTECIFEAREKQISLERTLNKPYFVSAGYGAVAYGIVVEYKVGCKGVE